MVFYGLRPVVVGLIASAAVFIGKTALVHLVENQSLRDWFATLFRKPLDAIQPAALLIFAATLVVHHKFKLHPLILIMGAGLAGILLQFIF